MGYRNDVLVIIKFDSNDNAKNYFDKFDLQQGCGFEYKLYNDIIYGNWESIKWGYLDEIYIYLTSFYKTAEKTNGFIGWCISRIGENEDDYEKDYFCIEDEDNISEYIEFERHHHIVLPKGDFLC